MAAYRFDRMEWSGSVGDLGTLLPLAFAMIMINGLDATGLFASVGALYVLGGIYFRVPIAVQPMKVVAAYAVSMALSPQVITASGFLLAGVLLFLGFTGLVDRVAKWVPKAVVRGVQLSTGILLLGKGVTLIAGISSFQVSRGGAEPFLLIQALGPLPMSALLGVIFGVAALLLLNNKRFPAGLVVVGAGLVSGVLLGGLSGLAGVEPGLHLPNLLPFGLPSGVDISFALVALVAPQIPMTLGNAVIANRDLSFEYFGEESRRVTDRALCVSMGLANVLAACIGGMPLCHGAGGLAAHYRFGARTGGSNLIIGGLFLLLALVLGAESLNALQLLPMGALGVLLFFAGLQLALTIQDLTRRRELFIALAMLGIALVLNLAWAFGIGIALSWVVLNLGHEV